MATSYWESFTAKRIDRRRILKSATALSLGAGALALLGCSGDDSGGGSDGSPDTGSGGPPVRGGRLTYGLRTNEIATHNVLSSVPSGHDLAGQHVYDHLISTRVGEGAPYVLGAAEKVEFPNELTVVFTMKQGMKYQNIAPVNGRDVKASDIKATHELVKATAQANRSFQDNSMDRVEAPDDRTVIFHLKKPNAYLMTGTQLGDGANGCIIPVEIHANLASHRAIGSGPYEEVRADLNVRYEYRRFEGYREAAKVNIDERHIIVFNDPVGDEAAFRTGQSAIYNPEAGLPTVGDMEKALGDKIYSLPRSSLAPFTLNNGGKLDFNPLKRDIRAREALYRALDRQQYIDLLFQDKGKLPTALLTDGLADYQLTKSQTDTFFKRDPAAARKLLEAAGVLDREYVLHYHAPGNLAAQSAQIAQTQFRDVGLNFRIEGIPSAEGFERAGRGEYYVFTGGHPEYASPEIIMRQQHSVSGSRFAYTGLGDPAIDALVERSEIATQYQENVKLVKEVQMESLRKFTGYILLATRVQDQLLYQRVRDWHSDPSRTWQPRIEAWLRA